MAGKEINICLISKTYYMYDTRLRQQAKALQAAGGVIDVICIGPPEEHFEKTKNIALHSVISNAAKGSFLKYLSSTFAFAVLAFLKLISLSKTRKYSIVIVHTLPEFLIFIGFVHKLRGGRLWLDLRDSSVELFDTRWGKSPLALLRPVVVLFAKISCRFADHIITASPGFREKIVRRGVPEHKTTVIFNSADVDIFRYQPDRRFEKIESNAKLLYHGSVQKRFGIDIAVQALGLLQKKVPGSTLTIYGSFQKQFLTYLKKLIADTGLGDHVFLYNSIPLEAVYEKILDADIGIVPYRSDNFMNLAMSTKTFEYAASGLPVVSSRLKPSSYVFDDSCIMYAEPGNPQDFAAKLEQLCLNPDLRKAHSVNAMRANAAASGAAMWQRYGDLLHDCLREQKT